MKKLALIVLALVLLDPGIELPRIGNCRTLPNQAACMGGLAIGDVPTDGRIHFYAGKTIELARIGTDGRFRWSGSPGTTRWFIWPDGTVYAQEKVVLTAPVFTSAGVTDFRVWVLDLRRTHPDRPAGILAVYREVNVAGFVLGGKALECRYEGAEADTLIVALNRANLATISLEKRLIQRCQADGKLGAGTISGVPQ